MFKSAVNSMNAMQQLKMPFHRSFVCFFLCMTRSQLLDWKCNDFKCVRKPT